MKRSGPLTRRTGLRRTPLPRGEAKLSRTVRLRPINPERRARLQAEQYGPHGAWLRTQPCAVTGQWGTDLNPVVAAHAWRTRGAGGKAKDCIPLLLSLEVTLHTVGRLTFQEAYGVDLAARAAWYADHSPELHPAIAARTDVLPCEDCSAKGPHAPVLHADGSYTARCATCRGIPLTDERHASHA